MHSRSTFDKAIIELTQATEDKNTVEAVFQEILEINPCILRLLGFTRIIPHPSLENSFGESFIPDFLCQDLRGLWHIVEIKRANAKTGLRGKSRRSRPYAEMSEWIAQGEEYSRWLSQNPAKEAFEDRYQTKIQINPGIKIIAGQATTEQHIRIHESTSTRVPAIELHTYTDILNSLYLHRERLFGSFENSTGFTLISSLVVARPDSIVTLLSIGESKDKNNLTITLNEDFQIIVKCAISNGKPKLFSIEADEHRQHFESPFILSVDVLSNAQKSQLWVRINDYEVLHFSTEGSSFSFNKPVALIVGTDPNAEECAEMMLYFITLIEKPISPTEYEALYRFAEHTTTNPGQYYLHFLNGAYMYTEGHPVLDATYPNQTTNLVQRNNSRRPILRLAQ